MLLLIGILSGDLTLDLSYDLQAHHTVLSRPDLSLNQLMAFCEKHLKPELDHMTSRQSFCLRGDRYDQ